MNSMSQWIGSLIGSPRRRALPILTSPGIHLIGKKADEVFRSGEAQFLAIKALVDRFPMAAAPTMMDLSVEAEAFGASIKFDGQENPNVTAGIVENMDDITRMEIPDVGAARTGEYLRTASLCAEGIGDRPTLGGMIGPFSLAGRLIDMNRLMLLSAMEPKTVHALLEKTTQFLVEYAKAFKATGCGGLIMAEPAAGLISSKMAKEFSYDYVRRIVDAVRDEQFVFILHNCGKTDRMVKEMLSTGASALHVGNAVAVETILEQTPEDIPVMGNMDPSAVFLLGTPDKVFDVTIQLLESTKRYPHFVLSSGCDIPPGTPLENVSAFFNALERYNSQF